MRLFGTFKSIEIYIILSAIFLLFTFNQLCEKKEENMEEYWRISKLSNKSLKVEGPSTQLLVADPPSINISREAEKGFQEVVHGVAKPVEEYWTNHTLSNKPLKVEGHVLKVEGHVVPNDTTPAPLRPTTPLIIADPPPPPFAISREAEKGFQEVVHGDAKPVEEHIIIHKVSNKPSTVEGYVLPTDTTPSRLRRSTPLLVADPPPPPIAISREAEKGFQEVIHGDAKPVEEYPTTHAPQVLASTLKQNDGFWDNVLGVFGGNKRIKRDVFTPAVAPLYNQKPSLIANQTYFGVYRCEKAGTIFTHMDPFNDRNIYQQMFAWRFWGVLFLFIHLLLVIYHCFVNIMHRVPTSQRFNRVFAFIGLIIWDLITLWVVYQCLMWDHKFIHAISPIYPSVPSEFYAFLILSFAMNIFLLYELITPMTFFLSYDITPRHPRRGYIPAAQSENEYISGIIAQLESAPAQPNENVKSRPVIRAFDNNMV